jgi:uncharacterized protein YbjT (DUF2867 family)
MVPRAEHSHARRREQVLAIAERAGASVAALRLPAEDTFVLTAAGPERLTGARVAAAV